MEDLGVVDTVVSKTIIEYAGCSLWLLECDHSIHHNTTGQSENSSMEPKLLENWATNMRMDAKILNLSCFFVGSMTAEAYKQQMGERVGRPKTWVRSRVCASKRGRSSAGNTYLASVFTILST